MDRPLRGMLAALAIALPPPGSGTSWLPESAPMFAHHFEADGWTLMLHYFATAGYDDQWSDRGSRRVLSTNWLMGMATHSLAGGQLTLRSMLSLEPATAGGADAIPLLLQSGETWGGQPLHDRQHPHDFFMEVAALYRHDLGDALGIELYGAPAGEPALGPTAFMHRPSAMSNPVPPIGHHWQDSTHISFGVLTAGLYSRFAKLEGSLFHGREPDEDRWNFDLGALDSWSTRLSVNPTPELAMQVSYGFLNSPEAIDPGTSIHRMTASTTYANDDLAATLLWGRNIEPEHSSDSFTFETSLNLGGNDAPFLRLELVDKSAHELVVPGDVSYDVFLGTIGYVHRFQAGPIVPLVGAAIDVGVIPGSLEPFYGTRYPLGAWIFAGLEPPRMSHEGHMRGMPGM